MVLVKVGRTKKIGTGRATRFRFRKVSNTKSQRLGFRRNMVVEITEFKETRRRK